MGYGSAFLLFCVGVLLGASWATILAGRPRARGYQPERELSESQRPVPPDE